MKTYASLLLASALASTVHAGSFSFDDSHPSFTLPASGTKKVVLSGTVTLGDLEKDANVSPFVDPSLPGYTGSLVSSVDPAFAAYASANVFGADYHGPILDFYLTPTTAVGDYTVGDGIYSPFVYFGYSVYDDPQNGRGVIDAPYGKYGYAINVRPVPEPASLAALGLGAAAMLRRRRRA